VTQSVTQKVTRKKQNKKAAARGENATVFLLEGEEKNTKVAGAAGFEPTNHGVKVRCLTAWLCPYKEKRVVKPHCSNGNCRASFLTGGKTKMEKCPRQKWRNVYEVL
jgi:hypothetical protein